MNIVSISVILVMLAILAALAVWLLRGTPKAPPRRYASKYTSRIAMPVSAPKASEPSPTDAAVDVSFGSFEWPQRTGTWRDDPMSDPQRDFIRELGGKPSRGMTKGQASDLIDRLIQERDEREWREQLAAAEETARKKEASELAHVAAAMRDKPEYKARKGTSKRTQDLREFQYLLARVFADDVIEPVEAREILSWLESRKIESDDFRAAFRFLPQIAAGASVPVAGDIQAALLDCLRTLRARPTV